MQCECVSWWVDISLRSSGNQDVFNGYCTLITFELYKISTEQLRTSHCFFENWNAKYYPISNQLTSKHSTLDIESFGPLIIWRPDRQNSISTKRLYKYLYVSKPYRVSYMTQIHQWKIDYEAGVMQVLIHRVKWTLLRRLLISSM